MLCGNCGREFEGRFCPSCGEPVPVPVVCKSCGTTFEGNFCTNCGTPYTAGENSSLDNLIDKFGNELDIHYIATLYETEKKIKRFLMLATKYSPSEIEKRARYIHENVDEYDYGELKCFSERGKLNEIYREKNQSLAKMFAFVAVFLSIVVVALYVSNGLLGLSSTEESPYAYGQFYAGGAVSDAPSAIEISASNLLDAYDANQIAADRSYKDKELVVTGILKNIGEDIIGNVYITVGNGDAFELYSVQCYFSSSEEIDKVARLSAGDSVIVTGTCSGKSLNVLLDSCSLN